MKRIALLAALAFATPAMAQPQVSSAPSVLYGQPYQPQQVWHTEPQLYGHPEFGVVTTGPNRQTCFTEPQLYGHPEFGVTTICR
jgi:hypothetical protein